MSSKLPVIPAGEGLPPLAGMEKLEIVAISGFDALVLDPHLRRQRLRPSPVSINETIRRMAPGLRRAFGPLYEFVLLLDECTPRAMVDRTQFETALLNLAINARNAMPLGGRLHLQSGVAVIREAEDARERPVAMRPGRYVSVSISDDGMGMAADLAATAAHPRFAVDRQTGGGLGLAMVNGFVDQAGGHLQVTSPSGAGTTVRLFLPALNAQAADSASSHQHAASRGVERHSEHPAIA